MKLNVSQVHVQVSVASAAAAYISLGRNLGVFMEIVDRRNKYTSNVWIDWIAI
jgi:hypothetical protein